jgi:eukaryotic-like serine/threonine-protein kinase
MSSPTGSQRRIGSYQLLRRIAVGGMAEVFEARGGADQQSLVVKLLLPQFRTDADFIRMFEDEARLTTTLVHPHLVRVFALAQEAGERFMVMEFVDGVPLAQLLKGLAQQDERLPVPLALLITAHLLEALHFIHGRVDENGRPLEIVHRDVTPGNVLLSRDGAVKLGDFGIARHRLRSTRTRTGVIKGTVQYMAPEQITGSGLDARTDLYGVGLILFEMLTGRAFIQGEREVEMISMAQDPPWQAPSALRPELDPALDRLLRPALMRFPEERYPTAQSFLAAVQGASCLDEARERDLEGQLGALVCQAQTQAAATFAAAAVSATEVGPGLGSIGHSSALASFGSTLSAAGSIADEASRVEGGQPRPRDRSASRGAAFRRYGWLLGGISLLGLATGLLWPVFQRPAVRQDEDQAQTRAAPRLDAALAPDHDLARSAASLARDLSSAEVRSTPLPGDRHLTRPGVKSHNPVAIKPFHGHTPRVTPPDAGASLQRSGPALLDEQRQKDLVRAGAQFKQMLMALQAHGILMDDLGQDLRQRIFAAQQQLTHGEAAAALTTLASLAPACTSLRVDRPLVETKLKRVDQLLRQAKSRGQQVQPLQERSTIALQEFMDGRYTVANSQLNAILFALGRR